MLVRTKTQHAFVVRQGALQVDDLQVYCAYMRLIG